MFIYNVTTKIDWSIQEAWLRWMQDIHIPEVLGTGCFEKHQLVRLLDTDEAEGPTYAIQYYAVSRAQYRRYMELYAPAQRQAGIEKWGNRMISFHSLMEVVN
jgi:hypothetical protein